MLIDYGEGTCMLEIQGTLFMKVYSMYTGDEIVRHVA